MTGAARGILLALMAFAAFSTHDVVIKSLGQTYSIFQIAFFSVLFGFPLLAVSMSAEPDEKSFRPHHPWWLALRLVMIVITMMCVFYAFTVLPLVEVYAILFAMPVLITALSVPLLGEVVRARRWIAVAAGMIGVLIVLRPGVTVFTWGHVAAITGAATAALGTIIIRKIGSDERTEVLVLFPMMGNLVVTGTLLPFVYKPMPFEHVAMMGGIGILVFAGQMLMVVAYKAASAALVAPMQYSQILWATLFGAMFFNEYPDLWVYVGAGVVIASGLYIVWRESQLDVSDVQPVLRNANLRRDTGVSPRPRLTKPEANP